jgi:hypothetical protein
VAEITPEMIEAGKDAFLDVMHSIDGYELVPTSDQLFGLCDLSRIAKIAN